MIDIKETDGINIGNKKFIVLVGLMGSGKTSLGKAIAKLLNLPFVDSDLEIAAISDRVLGMGGPALLFENQYFAKLKRKL